MAKQRQHGRSFCRLVAYSRSMTLPCIGGPHKVAGSRSITSISNIREDPNMPGQYYVEEITGTVSSPGTDCVLADLRVASFLGRAPSPTSNEYDDEIQDTLLSGVGPDLNQNPWTAQDVFEAQPNDWNHVMSVENWSCGAEPSIQIVTVLDFWGELESFKKSRGKRAKRKKKR